MSRKPEKEPRPAILLRLLSEAQLGVKSEVTLADALESQRQKYGLTRAELAAILGMQSSHFSEVINGHRTLPIKATRRAYAIGVPAVVLLQNPDGETA